MVRKLYDMFKSATFPQPRPYQKLIHHTVKQSLFYFFCVVFIGNSLLVGINAIKHLSQQTNYINFFTPFISSLESFPSDLNIQVFHKTLTTNSEKPEFFWATIKNTPFLYLVIDEYAEPEKINEYKSTILLTHKNIVFYDKGSIKIKSIPAVSLEINKKSIQAHLPFITMMYLFYPFLIGLFLLILKPLMFIIFSLLLLRLISLVVFYTLKRQSKLTIHITRQNLFKIGLFSSTLPIILFFLVQIGGWEFKTWFCYPITILLFYGVAVYETMMEGK